MPALYVPSLMSLNFVSRVIALISSVGMSRWLDLYIFTKSHLAKRVETMLELADASADVAK